MWNSYSILNTQINKYVEEMLTINSNMAFNETRCEPPDIMDDEEFLRGNDRNFGIY